jgi:hypothetical protein
MLGFSNPLPSYVETIVPQKKRNFLQGLEILRSLSKYEEDHLNPWDWTYSNPLSYKFLPLSLASLVKCNSLRS